jgi:VanZ family protein
MRIFARYWKTILCAAAIAMLSLAPLSAPSGLQVPHADKWVHALMYAALAVAAFLDVKKRFSLAKIAIFLLILPVFYGGLMEILQEFCTPSRSSSFGDLVADILGGWLATFTCIFLYKFKKK